MCDDDQPLSQARAAVGFESVADCEATEEERAFMRAVVAGLADVMAGREFSLAEAKAQIGLK